MFSFDGMTRCGFMKAFDGRRRLARLAAAIIVFKSYNCETKPSTLRVWSL